MPKNYRTNASRARLALALACLGLIGITWAIATERVRFERAETVANAMRSNANLALAFEEQTVRTLKGVDQILLFVKHEYAEYGRKLDIRRMIASGTLDAGLFWFVGIADERGDIVLGSQDFSPVNLAYAEDFKFHQRNDDTKMFIGKSILGRITHKQVIPMSRRINKADGSFGGMVIASVDPGYFTNFYRKADLGEQGAITLVGFDRIARARKTGQSSGTGQDLRGITLFAEQAKSDVGSFIGLGRIDGVVRFVSYRTVHEYPLIVAVGTSQDEVLASFRERTHNYYAMAGFASILIVLFAAFIMTAWSRQKSAFDSLVESGARFRATFDQMAVGVVHTTLDGHFIDANAKMSAILGYTRAEMRALKSSDIIASEDLDQTEIDRRRLITGEFANVVSEMRCLRKDRAVCWINRGLSLVRDNSGKPQYFISLLIDITERKLLEETLRTREEHVRVLFDTLPLCVGHADAEERITFGNALYRATYVGGANPAGRKIRDVIGEQVYAVVAPRIRQVLAGQEVLYERTYTRADGTVGTRSLRYVPDRNSPGEVTGFFALIDDITERKLAEQEAFRQYRLSEAFFNGSVTCLVVLDRNFNFLRVNAAYARVCRRDIGEFAGHNHFEMYPSDTQAIFEEVIRTKRPFETFTRAFTFADQPERGVTYWDWTLVPILDQHGEVEYLVFSLNEVTERERAEEALRESERRYREVVDNVDEVVYVIDVNPQEPFRGVVRFVSSRATQIVGCRPEEFLADEGLWFSLLHPDDIPRLLEQTEALYASCEPGLREYRVRHRATGEYRWIEDLVRPHRNADGTIISVFGVARDITERKHAEIQLRLAASVFETTPDGIMVTDKDNIVVSVNEAFAKITGYSAQEMIGKNPRVFQSGVQKPAFYQEMWAAINEAGHWQGDMWDRRKNGELYCQRLSIGVVRDDRGKIINYCAIFADITERKRAEDALRQSLLRLQALSERVMKIQRDERDSIARELHDELGQSLTALKVNLQILEPYCTGGEAEDHLAEALMIVGRSLEQVRGMMLDLRPPALEELGLAAVLESHLAQQAEAAGWNAHFDASALAGRLRPELENACYRVAQEALTNVMRHAGARQVWVVLGLNGGQVELSVRDDGAGFDVAAASDGSLAQSFGLTGMHERARQMGGRLSIRSAPGCGTEVRASFPATPVGRRKADPPAHA